MLLSRTASAVSIALVLGYVCAGQTLPATNPAPPPSSAVADKAASEAAPEPPAAENVSGAKSPAVSDAKAGDAKAGDDKALPGKAGTKKPYIFGPLDVVQVAVWGSKEITGLYPISDDGFLSLPLLGDIPADGLTKEELGQKIREKLGESVFAKVPEANEVSVTLVKNNSKKIYVYGAVAREGTFPLDGEMTIMDVLAMCLPFQEFAKRNDIYVLRNGKPLPFRYDDFLKGKRMDLNIPLKSGDRLIIKGQ